MSNTESIDTILREINYLEALQELKPTDLSEDDRDYLNVLNICYELLARTNRIVNEEVGVVEWVKYNRKRSRKYKLRDRRNSKFWDFIYDLVSYNRMTVNFRLLLTGLMKKKGHGPTSVMKSLGKNTGNTLSWYLLKKHSMASDTLEGVLNMLLNEEDYYPGISGRAHKKIYANTGVRRKGFDPRKKKDSQK